MNFMSDTSLPSSSIVTTMIRDVCYADLAWVVDDLDEGAVQERTGGCLLLALSLPLALLQLHSNLT